MLFVAEIQFRGGEVEVLFVAEIQFLERQKTKKPCPRKVKEIYTGDWF